MSSSLKPQTLSKRGFVGNVNTLLSRNGDRQRMARNDECNIASLFECLTFLRNARNQTGALSFIGGHVTACQHKFHCLRLSDGADEALRTACGRDGGELDFRLSKGGILGSDYNIRGHCKLATATKRKAVNGGYQGLSNSGHPIEVGGSACAVEAIARGVVAARNKLGDVGTGCEDALRARDNDDVDGGVVIKGRGGFGDLEEGVVAKGVEIAWAMDFNDGDTIFA